MAEFAAQFNGTDQLYPPIEPFAKGMLPVGDRHSIFIEQCGSPGGLPVLFLHGGPGGGCNPVMRRYFNPRVYRVVLFDQRGCGRSVPAGSIEANTTWHLVEDIERIRRALGIERWILFGGSWGATLALIYAQEHAERVHGLVLRGTFLMTPSEIDWFYGGGAGRFRPDQWKLFTELIPEDEQDDLVGAYGRRLFCGDYGTEVAHAQRWMAWEVSMLALQQPQVVRTGPPAYARTFARIENHYFSNLGFLESSNHVLDNIGKMRGVPGVVVQGRYDLVCPPQAAWSLTQRWPESRLELVQAGHSLAEPEITSALIKVMDEIGQDWQDDPTGMRMRVASGSAPEGKSSDPPAVAT